MKKINKKLSDVYRDAALKRLWDGEFWPCGVMDEFSCIAIGDYDDYKFERKIYAEYFRQPRKADGGWFSLKVPIESRQMHRFMCLLLMSEIAKDLP